MQVEDNEYNECGKFLNDDPDIPVSIGNRPGVTLSRCDICCLLFHCSITNYIRTLECTKLFLWNKEVQYLKSPENFYEMH